MDNNGYLRYNLTYLIKILLCGYLRSGKQGGGGQGYFRDPSLAVFSYLDS